MFAIERDCVEEICCGRANSRRGNVRAFVMLIMRRADRDVREPANS
jgi:hypothetical protein